MTSFEEYTDQFGFHFNKKLYEWAVSMMRDRGGSKIQPKSKEQVSEFLRTHGITLKKDKGYDAAYVHAMGMADYYGSSITDEAHLAMFVKDFLDDPDGTDSKAFDHFVVDCRAKDEPVFWDEML
jgi:hypothetical protein